MKSNLKKSISLLMAAVMILTAVSMMFTSCSSEDEEVTADIGETITTRKPLAITLYGVTGESTTPEAIKEVEERLNRLSESEYATTIVLKLFTEDEYRDALEDKYVTLQHDAEVAEFCESAKKISDRVDKKRNKLLSEAEQSEKTAAAEKAAKEAKEKAAKEAAALAEAIEKGEAVATPVEENQVDIVFINDFEHYMDSINAEPDPVIIPLDEYLKLDSKILTDYIHPTLLSAAKIGGFTYGLPINKGIEAETTYCLMDKELVEKYQFDTTQIMNFANIEYFLADVKANEPDVIPLLKAPEEVQGYDFYNNEIGHPIGITNPEFGEYTPVTCRRTYSEFAVTNFFDLMANFRESGYLPDPSLDTTGMRFAVDIRKGTESDVKEWEEQGYVVEVYKTARATTENTLGAMYAISSYSKNPARCMEILEMLYTQPEFKNIFTFGVEGVNYTVNSDNTITRLNNDYSMDFMKSGNTFIGLLDEGMDPDYVKNAVEKNFNVKRHGFLAFQIKLTEEEQKAMDFYVETTGDSFETLRQGLDNADLAYSTYSRLATKLDRGFTNDNIPGLRTFLFGEDDVPSKWGLAFDDYKTTIPLSVAIEDKKDLSSYIVENKNDK